MLCKRCETADSLPLSEMIPFQGGLKSRTEGQIEELKRSLLDEGLLAPFFIWKGALKAGDEEKSWIIDGHARREALRRVFLETGDDSFWLKERFPVVYISAESPDEARKALLQITSSYGEITSSGAKRFCEGLRGYSAPSVAAFLKPVEMPKSHAAREIELAMEPRAAPRGASAREASAGQGEALITVAARLDVKDEVMSLLCCMDGVRVIGNG